MPPTAPSSGSRRPALPLVGQLLAHAAGAPDPGPPGTAFGWRDDRADDRRQLEWVFAAGLAPLLQRACSEADAAPALPSQWRDRLLGAELSARVRHGRLVETALEVLDACDGLGLRATLLKGISVSEQWYPAEHLRPMADLDLLLPAPAHSALEAALLRRGFVRLDYPTVPGQHHGAPLVDGRRHTVVELHRQLFPDDSPLRAGSVFALDRVERCSVDSSFHGRAVRRLDAELQLAYIASSWCNDLTLSGVQPSFVASMLDAIYLLGATGARLDWPALLVRLDNRLARASLQALLGCLPRYGAAPAPGAVMQRLAAAPGAMGALQLGAMRWMVERHLIGARPWPYPLPPPVPGRYDLRRQFAKRVLRRTGV